MTHLYISTAVSTGKPITRCSEGKSSEFMTWELYSDAQALESQRGTSSLEACFLHYQ